MYRIFTKREARQSRSMPDQSPTKIDLPRRARSYSENTTFATASQAEALADAEDAPVRVQSFDPSDERVDTYEEWNISPSLAAVVRSTMQHRDAHSVIEVVQVPCSRPPTCDAQNYPPYSQLSETEDIAAGQNLQILLLRADAEHWSHECLERELGVLYNLGFLSARLLNVGMLAVYRRYSAIYHAFGFQYYMRRYLRERYDHWRQKLEAEIVALILRADLPPSTALQVRGTVPLQRQIGLGEALPRGNETQFLASHGFDFVAVQDYIVDRYQDRTLNLDQLRMEIRVLLCEFQFDPVDERDLGMRIRDILATRYNQLCVYFSHQFENGIITREVLIETLRPLFLTFHLDLDPSWERQFNAEMENNMSAQARQRNQQMMQNHQQRQQQARRSLPADQVADQDPVPSYEQATLQRSSSVQDQVVVGPPPPSYSLADVPRSSPIMMPPLSQRRPGQGPFPPSASPTMGAGPERTTAILSTNPFSLVNRRSVLEGPHALACRARPAPPTFGQSEAIRVQEEEEDRLAMPEVEFPRLQPSRRQLPVFDTATPTRSGSGSPESLSDDEGLFPISMHRAPRSAPATQEEEHNGGEGSSGGRGGNGRKQ